MSTPDDKYLFYVRRPEDSSDAKAGGICWLQPPPYIAPPSASSTPAPPASNVPSFKSLPPTHSILNTVREYMIPFVCPATSAAGAKDVWHVIVNPAAGAKTAQEWGEKAIKPLLEFAGSEVVMWNTASPGDGVQVAKKVLADHTERRQQGKLGAVLLGGDGTTSEFLNGLAAASATTALPGVELALVPLGTANALFYSRHPAAKVSTARGQLVSLLSALLATSDPTRPPPRLLPLAKVEIVGGTETATQTLVAHVVVSTALHAELLKSADELRGEAEGLERFKKAFAMNAARTYSAQASFETPTEEGAKTELYDCDSKAFVPLPAESATMAGPFSYFTAALVDRFEHSFVIAPLRNPATQYLDDPYEQEDKMLGRSLDLVVVRPARDPQLAGAAANEIGERFVGKLQEVMGAAYQNGKHVEMKYGDQAAERAETSAANGSGELHGQTGLPVVEYIRAGSWKWEPQGERQHVCVDGTVIPIPAGGYVRCTVLNTSDIRAH